RSGERVIVGPDELERLAHSVLLPGFAGTSAPPEWLVERIAAGLGGVVLFGRNCVDDGQVAALVSALRVGASDLLVAIDEEDGGVRSSVKHFPGHGDTALDSHLTLPVVARDRAGLDAVELVPFRAAVAAGAASVMTAHLVVPALDPDLPATLSRAVVGELLR